MKLFSGIQPSGTIHIGNYLGAIKNWAKLQDKYQSLFCVVDYHAITSPYDPDKLPARVINTVLDFVSCGIDPQKSIIFVQSHVKEHTELAWLLNSITSIGSLKRMTQFKEKMIKYPKDVNAGILNYPILMTADILLYKAEVVPVGEDQVQHIELAREIARKFNKKFGKTFPEPKPLLTKSRRIMSLIDPTRKMSKSFDKNTYIAMTDSKETIWKKIASAMTDPARKTIKDPGNPNKCNIYNFHEIFSSKQELNKVVDACTKAKFGCLDCKQILFKNIMKELEPIQAKRKQLEQNPAMIQAIIKKGAQQAQIIATQTILEVKKKMGII
ncbi:tryptophan--tRNA ligase [Patescibacteria group bacterium]|nr:tryptophan--tRNA ligase [Patescibacteria group bacterium]